MRKETQIRLLVHYRVNLLMEGCMLHQTGPAAPAVFTNYAEPGSSLSMNQDQGHGKTTSWK